MARQHSARWTAGASERTRGNRGDLTRRFPTPRVARNGDPGTVGADVLLTMAGIAAPQGTEPPGVAGFLRRFLAPYYYLSPIRARRLQSAGSQDSTRGRVLMLTIHSWRIIRFGAGDHKRDHLKTIALELRPAVAECKELNPGYNDGLPVESADPDAGKVSRAGVDGTAKFLAAGRSGVRHLDNTDLVEIQNGR